MVNWARFTPVDFEYDFERDELAPHKVSFEEAVECFFSGFEIRRNKSYKDRYQLLGRTQAGRCLKLFSTEAGQCRPDHFGMAAMNKKSTPLTEREIDDIIVAQADDDTAWGRSVRTGKDKAKTVPLPTSLATRAAFFARLHREKSMDAWIERIVRDRLDVEEAAFADLKRELAAR
ncbi:MAG: hypothetical protein OXF11_17805 [Deltaproteobacteria bacterium]|nr:hypothetical protein [Deltaproteobacteria bacterium]